MKKIKNIAINNFKSIKHLEINDCNKINVFIGKPNAGKSNILEALGMFGMLNSFNYELEDFVRFNNSNELFFEGNIAEKIKIIINDVQLHIERVKSKNIFIDSLHYFGLNEELKYDFNFAGEDQIYLNNEVDTNGRIPAIKKYQFKEIEFVARYNQSSLDFPTGLNLVQVLSSNSFLRKKVNDLFIQNGLRLLIDKSSNDIKIFKEYQDGTVFTLSYSLIADTLQRLIFYIAAILTNENSILLFEEPEAHCFEPYILEFTNSVKYDKNNNQFFIVTHSDFIIQEFLRDEESRNNTNIYLVSNVEGETKAKLLDKNNNDDVYEFGMNVFFNFENLWESN